ncbi:MULTISPECIES: ferredoxin reductase family protein [Streptomyces]|uniref:ferredoxin reductase family protein n=1 Tax=Streptomyces TaxID=1883 RepID=UPI000767304E|nr:MULTISPECIES: ferredoxin reductase family protein [Streptomyces]MBW8093435.1 ferredoxin reductase family protein [Streptomyces hygroscopicus subsp. hygroscopicus]MCO8302706.1 ferredoxin reductase family protein [Streptomyces sp. RKCA744]
MTTFKASDLRETTFKAPDLRDPPPTSRGRRAWVWRFGLADLLGPLGILSVVAVVCLWVRFPGVNTLWSERGWGALGLLAGLVAADLMVLQVILLARIPWVERAWGHDVLTRRHRWIGFTSFWLMLVHVATFAYEYIARDPSGVASALWALFVTDPWMLLATTGALLLIMVVVTSVRAARRRLRYESWHLMHLYSYLGIALTFPHMIELGPNFHEAWAKSYWWVMYGLAFTLTLVYRVGTPIWRSAYHRLRVHSVTEEAPGAATITLTGHRLDRLKTQSGQFFVWRFLDGPGWTRGNPYSLSAAPTDDRLRLTIKGAGDGSARHLRLAPGTRALIEGPYGTLTARGRRHPHMLMIAAGIGITPLRAILEDAPYEPGEATLLYRYSADEHAVLLDEVRELARARGIRVHLLPGPRQDQTSWLPAGSPHTDDAAALHDLVPQLAVSDVYACGPTPWLRAVTRACRTAGVHRDDLHTEVFAW